jgi:hypothetical protein
VRPLAAAFVVLAALACLGASPGARTIPHPGGGPALIVPAGSPVRFAGFDKNGVAHFKGRFQLNGNYTYGCRIDCEEPPIPGDNLELNLLPDPSLTKRMPHWQDRGDDMVIELTATSKQLAALATRAQVAALRSGKLDEVRGHIVVTADDFVADFGCDYSPYYAARVVALSKPPTLAKLDIKGDFGCA